MKALSRALITYKRLEQSNMGSGTLDPALFPKQIEYLPDHRLLFCRVHKQVVPLSRLEAHLFRTHSAPKPVRQNILGRFFIEKNE